MSALTFRKKPVEVEAMQFDATTNEQAMAVYKWIEANTQGSFDPTADEIPASGVGIDPVTGFLCIATLEGVIQAKPGDWIIRGVQGEFYPCKPDIFEATYEPASASPAPGGADAVTEASRYPEPWHGLVSDALRELYVNFPTRRTEVRDLLVALGDWHDHSDEECCKPDCAGWRPGVPCFECGKRHTAPRRTWIHDEMDAAAAEWQALPPNARPILTIDAAALSASGGSAVDKGAEPLASQVERLAEFIVHNIPGEPSESEGAIDTAIRLLRTRSNAIGGSAVDEREEALIEALQDEAMTVTGYDDGDPVELIADNTPIADLLMVIRPFLAASARGSAGPAGGEVEWRIVTRDTGGIVRTFEDEDRARGWLEGHKERWALEQRTVAYGPWFPAPSSPGALDEGSPT